MASPQLAGMVSGVTQWQVNADEPRVLDYNEEFKSVGQVTSLYNPDAYRSSDHDPVIIGLQFMVPLPGDVNGDSCVDRTDWRTVKDAAKNGSTNLTYDVNGDGVVDKKDRKAVKRLFTNSGGRPCT
jgi:hypothetical protein